MNLPSQYVTGQDLPSLQVHDQLMIGRLYDMGCEGGVGVVLKQAKFLLSSHPIPNVVDADVVFLCDRKQHMVLPKQLAQMMAPARANYFKLPVVVVRRK